MDRTVHFRSDGLALPPAEYDRLLLQLAEERRIAADEFSREVVVGELERITAFGREHGIGLHLDGARIFLASAYTGITPANYAASFDTVYVSLYKYFNAAAGAVLAGPRELIENLYHQRRMFGGSLRQAWPYAAVALHYLDGFGERFERAAAAAETLFQALHGQPGCEVRRPAAATNVTRLRVFGVDAETLPERLLARGIEIRPALYASPERAEFELFTNETILRRPANEIAAIFIEALEPYPARPY